MGLQGPKGDMGTEGPTGPKGTKGDVGRTGDTGAQGLPGPAGAQGVPGTKGTQGPKGDPGAPGSIVRKISCAAPVTFTHDYGSSTVSYTIIEYRDGVVMSECAVHLESRSLSATRVWLPSEPESKSALCSLVLDVAGLNDGGTWEFTANNLGAQVIYDDPKFADTVIRFADCTMRSQ